MKFRAQIRTENGTEETRTIEAESRVAVYQQLQHEGATVIELEEGSAGFQMPSWLNMTIGTGVKRGEVVQFAKNLSAMLNAGLSLSRALAVIEKQIHKKPFKAVVAELNQTVERGASFHEALAKHPKIFPALFISMAQAGEESGGLSNALTTVGIQMERSEQLIRKIRGAMIYPSIVIFAVIVIAILMLIYVVPTLTATFQSLHTKVPLATRVIVAMSNALTSNILLSAVLIIGGFGGLIAFVRSQRGATLILAGALYLPAIGELIRETYAARAARTLSSLLSAGVPVLEALQITKAVVHAKAFAAIVEHAEENVRNGGQLSESFAGHDHFYPSLMADMLAVGEETGKVADMLKQIAEFYEEDVAERTKDLSTIIEPILMLVIGSMVGVFAVAMIAPIYQLSSAF